jgi:hypothetical protein
VVDVTDLNRRDLLKGGAAGFLLGFLFRGRDGKLTEQPQVAEQPPTAVTITTMPQGPFRPERLMITGTVVGKRMVPETRFVPCEACDGREADERYCEVCGDLGGTLVPTGELVERDVTLVPWSIESFTIGGHAQFGSGAVPGDVFGANMPSSSLMLDSAGEGKEIRLVVRYTGDKPDGEVFRGALIGVIRGADGMSRHAVLPISSNQKIVA